MLSFAEYIARSCFIFTALLCTINVFGDSSGEQRMDLKLGFDFSQGENGSPSLRIRDFEVPSEVKPRAADVDVADHNSPLVRADSFSDSEGSKSSDEAPVRGENASKDASNSNEDSGDSDSDMPQRYSTKGLNPGEYEPEENPSIHAKFDGSESDSNSPHHRYKRGI